MYPNTGQNDNITHSLPTPSICLEYNSNTSPFTEYLEKQTELLPHLELVPKSQYLSKLSQYKETLNLTIIALGGSIDKFSTVLGQNPTYASTQPKKKERKDEKIQNDDRHFLHRYASRRQNTNINYSDSPVAMQKFSVYQLPSVKLGNTAARGRMFCVRLYSLIFNQGFTKVKFMHQQQLDECQFAVNTPTLDQSFDSRLSNLSFLSNFLAPTLDQSLDS